MNRVMYWIKLALLYFALIVSLSLLLFGIVVLIVALMDHIEDMPEVGIGLSVVGTIISFSTIRSIRNTKRVRTNYSIPTFSTSSESDKDQQPASSEAYGFSGYAIDPITQLEIMPLSDLAEYDELLSPAVEIVIDANQASTSLLQRRLKIGYSRATQIIDQLEAVGVVGPYEEAEPRKVMLTKAQWREMQKHAKDNTNKEDKSGSDSEWDTFFEEAIRAEENWRREQRGLSPVEDELYKIDHMEGHDFERWCAALIERNGFSDVSVTPGSNDQGVDVLAIKDSIKYAVQCKCYSSDLGNTPIQEVYAGKNMYDCHVGVVMTNRYFTSGAKALAQKTGVLLWDRDKVTEMIKSME